MYKEKKYSLDDGINYGVDYPSMAFTYDLCNILIELRDYEPILEAVILFTVLKTKDKQKLKNYLIDNNLISNTLNLNITKTKLKLMSKKELASFFIRFGFVSSGTKNDMIEFFFKNFPEDTFNDGAYKITPKGYDFLKENSWVEGHYNDLLAFDYNDFYRFVSKNEGDLADTILLYLDEHEKLAKLNKDRNYLRQCYVSRTYFYMSQNDDRNAFKMELSVFILSLNPQFSKDNNPIDFIDDNLYNIEVIIDDFTKDEVKDIFYEAWDDLNLNDEYLSEYEGFEFLIKYGIHYKSINLNYQYYDLFWDES